MSESYQNLIYQFPLSRLTLDVLLALRIIFDKPGQPVNLDADIEDLDQFPERLHLSYRHQWEAYVNRALVALADDKTPDETQDIIETMLDRVTEIKRNDSRYHRLLEKVNQVAEPQRTPAAPWRTQLLSVLLPISASRPDKPSEH